MTHYQSPLSSRYASKEMSELFSTHTRHKTWRKLWVALAEGQQKLGLKITDSQIAELKSCVDRIDFEKASEYEKQVHHDVMAHILAYGDQCPEARSIIHLGATSCYVTDNTDLILMRKGLHICLKKLELVVTNLSQFASKYRFVACLGYTHFQPAQLTTVGKRACMWIQDFILDYHELKSRLENLKFLGVKGTTGTQASFLSLFDQDHEKVKQLDQFVSEKMGFGEELIISGQTYTRKIDVQVVSALSGFAASAHKFAADLRLLSHLHEVTEPFEKQQVGSSAMPYKQNPILSERVCALARFAISLNENPLYTAATQWLERSLDDSANRRLSLPEAFLTADALLNLLIHLSSNLVVHPETIEKGIERELPFLATENILMAAVKKGKDRQLLHEKLRTYSLKGKEDLLKCVSSDPAFGLNEEDLAKIVDVKQFVGRAPQQVEEFLEAEVYPIIGRSK